MRKASGRTVQKSSRALTRVLRLAAVALGIGLLMTAGAVRAQEDDEDDKTFEEKIIEGIMAGIGGTNMENKGIEYRERSPLVVPPKIDLPPPASASADVKAPNWPKDPDEQRRKADAERAQQGQGSRFRPHQQRPYSARRQQQSDAQPVAARLYWQLRRSFRRQQERDCPIQGRTNPRFAHPAAQRISDAIAEFRLRHRAKRIAEQGI